MESSWFENIIKDVRNLFRLEKETNDTTFRGISNLFLLEKENKVIKKEYLEILEILLSMTKAIINQ